MADVKFMIRDTRGLVLQAEPSAFFNINPCQAAIHSPVSHFSGAIKTNGLVVFISNVYMRLPVWLTPTLIK